MNIKKHMNKRDKKKKHYKTQNYTIDFLTA